MFFISTNDYNFRKFLEREAYISPFLYSGAATVYFDKTENDC